jgi:hypothetical protein
MVNAGLINQASTFRKNSGPSYGKTKIRNIKLFDQVNISFIAIIKIAG